MKKFALLTLTAALGLMGLGAGNVQAAPPKGPSTPPTNSLVSTFSIVAFFSTNNSPVITSNANGTVITETYTTKTVTIATKDILNLLAKEFNTTFPAGAQLAFTLDDRFVVLDQGGNVFLDVSTNAADSSYRFSITNGSIPNAVFSGNEIFTKNTSTTNTVQNLAITEADFAIYYQDGKGNDFHFSGVVTESLNAFQDPNTATYEIKSASIILSGSGGGTFFTPTDGAYHKGVFTAATWRAVGVNLPEGP
ncbi:MAG: hypothetical protein WBN75_06195 [Verrucomicrobiia bacterium]|jgi:LysM repeat protein